MRRAAPGNSRKRIKEIFKEELGIELTDSAYVYLKRKTGAKQGTRNRDYSNQERTWDGGRNRKLTEEQLDFCRERVGTMKYGEMLEAFKEKYGPHVIENVVTFKSYMNRYGIYATLRANKDAEKQRWFEEHAKGLSTVQLTELANRELGLDLTVRQVHSYKKNHHIRSGTRSIGPTEKKFTPEIIEYIRSIAKGKERAVIAQMVREKFGERFNVGSIVALMKRKGITNGLDTRFQPGHIVCGSPFKKGEHFHAATEFKNGHIPYNKLELGAIVRRTDDTMWIKVAEGMGVKNYNQLSHYVWERANGPIPEGSCITFKDGNTLNCELDNLMLTTKSERFMMSRFGIQQRGVPESADAAQMHAKLVIEIAKKEKEYAEMLKVREAGAVPADG